jgi:hypothetical protein
LQEFCKDGMRLDEALAVVAEAASALPDRLTKIHGLGSAFPSHQQLETLGYISVLTALRQSPWAHRFEPVPPNQRRNFTALLMQWHDTIERGIQQRLGEVDTRSWAKYVGGWLLP